MTTAQTTPAAADPRPLAVQFARTFPFVPCRLTGEEMHQFSVSQRGGYAPWRQAGLVYLAETDRLHAAA